MSDEIIIYKKYSSLPFNLEQLIQFINDLLG